MMSSEAPNPSSTQENKVKAISIQMKNEFLFVQSRYTTSIYVLPDLEGEMHKDFQRGIQNSTTVAA